MNDTEKDEVRGVEYSTSPQLTPIAGVVLHMAGGWSAALNVQPDVTPLEATRLMVLLVIVSSSGHYCDVSGYIAEHGLTPHFEITDPGEHE